MAGNLSDYAEAAILKHSVGRDAWAKPTVYVGLFTTLPTDSTVAVSNNYAGEVVYDPDPTTGSNSKYQRVVTSNATWSDASTSGGSTTLTNITAITFNAAGTGGWGTVVGVGLFDAAGDAGNLIWWGPLTAPKTVAAGDVFQFGIGALTLSLD